MNTFILIFAPIGILTGIVDIILGYLSSPTNYGLVSLGMLLFIFNLFAFVIALAIHKSR